MELILIFFPVQIWSHYPCTQDSVTALVCYKPSLRFFEILASTYGPYGSGPCGSGPLIIWKNIQRQICSRNIFKMHTAPGACNKYASGAVCIQMMLLEHI